MKNHNQFLPEEIIRHILKRLPVKLLIQFQCICKHWKNIIKTPSFINEHIQHHSDNQNSYLLLEGICPSRPLHLYMPDREMQFLETPLPRDIHYLYKASFIDSSNGLLCIKLNISSPLVFLWNPVIRETRIEKPNVDKVDSFKIGFGYSAMVNDYKVVIISPFTKNEMVHQVDVYSLGTRSWKKVEFGNLLEGVAIKSDGKNINGAIFWFGVKLNVGGGVENDGYLIVSYDIANEVFTLIPLPISIPKLNLHDSHRKSLVVHKNKLALLTHTTIGNDESSLIDLWVMEEDIEASLQRWSWIKKYSVTHPFLLLPVTIWRNEIVCHFLRESNSSVQPKVKGLEANIVLANLTTNNKFKRFVINRCGYGYGILNYVESLVPHDDKTNHEDGIVRERIEFSKYVIRHIHKN